MKEKQILLVGMPRSGTSWVAKLFDSHPGVAYYHEPDTSIKLDFLDLIEDRTLDEELIDRTSRTVESFYDTREERVIGSLPLFPKSYMSKSQFYLYYVTNALAKYSVRLLGRQLISPIRPTKRAEIYVWKSIESLGRVRQLKQAVGNRTKIVHIIRHPAGQVLSTLSGERRKQFGGYRAADDLPLFRMILDTAIAEHLGYDFDRFEKLSEVQRLALRWAIYNDHALNTGACDFILNYDALCLSPRSEVEKLFDAVNVELTSEVQRFIELSTSTDTSKYYSVFKNPLASSLRWKKDLSTEQKHEMASALEHSRAYRLFDSL